MGIKTFPQPPYSTDLAPCDFCLFPKLIGCRYTTIGEMKEAVTKIIDTLTKEDFHGVFEKLFEWYNKSIAAGGDYFKEDLSFKHVLSIKVAIRKKSGNLFNDPRIYIYSYPQTDCFFLSELFSVARHAGCSKPGSKPVQLYVRLSFKPTLAKGILRYLF